MANELYIYDVIGEGFFESGVTDKSVRDDLKSLDRKQPLTVRINTPGGSVHHAIAIKTMIEEWPRAVTVQVDGLAASAGSYIAMAENADRVIMAQASRMMIHNPWTLADGDAKIFRKLADELEELGTDLLQAYVKRTNIEQAEIQRMMDETTWLNADKAIAMGFADEKVQTKAAAQWVPSIFGYKDIPGDVLVVNPRKSERNGLLTLKRRLDMMRVA